MRQTRVSSIQDSSVTLDSKQLKNLTNYEVKELYKTENIKPMCQIWLRTSMPGSKQLLVMLQNPVQLDTHLIFEFYLNKWHLEYFCN